ncbi:MAG TPA: LptE family protein [Candidatus Kapabacteria bacterium]|nr:LptE family protein [Candidatus Kapabacteria bacterium]
MVLLLQLNTRFIIIPLSNIPMINHFKYISIYLTCAFLLNACYSFTGGSVATHLKTIYIANVNDASGFGNPEYRDILTQSLLDGFQRDNSLTVVEAGGDCRLIVTITNISETPVSISPGELETDRRVSFVCNVEFFDIITQKQVFKRSFSNNEIYAVSEGQVGRDNTIKSLLTKTSEDILLSVVSGW